ncbi:MAG: hypothetical protein ACRYFX_10030 [Janthinobacterium lividum]
MPDALARLTTYGDQLLVALREEVKQKPVTRFGPVNASGQLAAGLRVEVGEISDGYRLSLYAPTYVLTLIYGRRPGKFPPLLAIEQWIEDKGIVPHPDAKGRAVSTKSLAYLIGRKLANKGTEIFKAGSNLFSEIAPDIAAKKLAEYLVPTLREEIIAGLLAAGK